MQTKLIAGMLGTATAAATLTALALLPGTSTDVDGTAVGPVAQLASAPAATGDGAMKQGIAVKGHWTIEVRNPDGTVAQRREFDNAFVGQQAVKDLLRGRRTMAGMSVLFGNASTTAGEAGNPCYGNLGPFGQHFVLCDIREPLVVDAGIPADNGMVSFTLLVNETTNGLQMTGTAVISGNPTSIEAVYAAYNSCGPDVATDACFLREPAINTNILTEHIFAPADRIPVVTMQQVLVTVELQFLPAT